MTRSCRALCLGALFLLLLTGACNLSPNIDPPSVNDPTGTDDLDNGEWPGLGDQGGETDGDGDGDASGIGGSGGAEPCSSKVAGAGGEKPNTSTSADCDAR